LPYIFKDVPIIKAHSVPPYFILPSLYPFPQTLVVQMVKPWRTNFPLNLGQNLDPIPNIVWDACPKFKSDGLISGE